MTSSMSGSFLFRRARTRIQSGRLLVMSLSCSNSHAIDVGGSREGGGQNAEVPILREGCRMEDGSMRNDGREVRVRCCWMALET